MKGCQGGEREQNVPYRQRRSFPASPSNLGRLNAMSSMSLRISFPVAFFLGVPPTSICGNDPRIKRTLPGGAPGGTLPPGPFDGLNGAARAQKLNHCAPSPIGKALKESRWSYSPSTGIAFVFPRDITSDEVQMDVGRGGCAYINQSSYRHVIYDATCMRYEES